MKRAREGRSAGKEEEGDKILSSLGWTERDRRGDMGHRSHLDTHHALIASGRGKHVDGSHSSRVLRAGSGARERGRKVEVSFVQRTRADEGRGGGLTGVVVVVKERGMEM